MPNITLGAYQYYNIYNNGTALTFGGDINMPTTAKNLYLSGTGTTTIQGGITGSGNNVRILGPGVLNLTGTNSYTCATSIYKGSVVLSGAGRMTGTSSYANYGGTVILDNTGTNSADRINSVQYTSYGSGLQLLGNPTANTAETMGQLGLPGGSLELVLTKGAGYSTELTFSSLNRAANSGATIAVTGENLGGTGSATRVKFTTAPTTTNGIIPYIFVNGTDFAVYDATNGIKAYSGYVPTIAGASATSNVKITASEHLTADKTINSLVISGNGDLTGDAGRTLTLSSGGGFLTTGTSTISVPTLSFAGTDGKFFNSGAVTISSAITGSNGLSKSGSGTLTLTGTYANSGMLSVNAGTLILGSADRINDNSILYVAEPGTLALANNNETVGGLTGYGAISLGSATLTTGANAAAERIFSGTISGSGGLTKIGTGHQRLAGTNTYTGQTTVQGGTLTLDIEFGALDPASDVVIEANGAFSAYNHTIGSLSGSGTLLTGRQSWGADTIKIGANGSSTTFDGVIANTPNAWGGINKIGTGTLTLSGANTYTYDTVVSAGSLKLGASHVIPDVSALTVAAGAVFDLNSYSDTVGSLGGGGNVLLGSGTLTAVNATTTTLSGTISGTGNFTKTGTATLGLTGTNIYSGATTVDSGTLTVYNAGKISGTGSVTLAGQGMLHLLNSTTNLSDRINDNASVTLAGGRILLAGNGSANTTETVGALTVSAGASKIAIAPGTGRTAELTAGPLTRADFGTLSFEGTNFGSGTSGARVKFTAVPSLDDGILPYAVVNGADFATYDGTYGITPYTGYVTSLSPAGSTDNVKISAAGNIASNTSVNSLIVNGNYNVTGSAGTTLTLESGGLLTTGTTTISVPTLAFGGVDGKIFTYGDTTIDSVITGNAGLSKSGSGSLTLTAATAYAGQTFINEGTLKGTTVSLQNNAAITVNTALEFAQSAAGTFAAEISGLGTLIKSGAGTLTLTGQNTLAGTTVVKEGTLAYGTDNALGTGAVTVTGGTLAIGSYSDAVGIVTLSGGAITGTGGVLTGDSYAVESGTVSAILAGTGTLTKSGAGVVTLSGSNTYSGGTTVSAGTLAGDTASLQGNITATGTVLFDQAGNGTYAGSLSGAGAFIKTGAGNVTCTSDGTFTGTAYINDGTLTYGKNSVFGTSGNGAIVVNGGVLDMGTYVEAVYSLTLSGGTITGTGASYVQASICNLYEGTIEVSMRGAPMTLTKSGAGTVTLTGTGSNYYGTTNINQGTVIGTTTSVRGTTFTNNGCVILNQAAGGSMLGNIGGAGTFVISGAGAVTLSGTNTFAGSTYVDGGTLVYGSANSVFGGDISVINGGVLNTGANSQTIGLLTLSGGTITGTGGGTITGTGFELNDTTLFLPLLGSGAALTVTGGTVTLGAANGYTGATAVNAGTLRLTAANPLSSETAVSVAAGALIDFLGNSDTIASLSGAGNVSLGSAVLTIGADNSSTVFSGAFRGAGGITKTGTGALTLGGVSSHSGATVIESGKLIVDGDISSTSGLTVMDGAVLAGSGILGDVELLAGGVWAPGNSPGTQFAADAVWNGGGTYLWEINDVNGPQGGSGDPDHIGYDWLNISGSLTINATELDKFIIDITSLKLDNTAGEVHNFLSTGNYSWVLATAADGISGFTAEAFALSTAHFVNALGTGSFSITQSGNNLMLNFSGGGSGDVPEPSTLLLLLPFIGFGLRKLRKGNVK